LSNTNRLLENAENCADMADQAKDLPSKTRYRRMEETYRRLAETQDWLDGRVSPFAVQSHKNESGERSEGSQQDP
jgi:hypothetical protein